MCIRGPVLEACVDSLVPCICAVSLVDPLYRRSSPRALKPLGAGGDDGNEGNDDDGFGRGIVSCE